MTRVPERRPPPVPDEADLHEAALRYLARYAATVAGVVRVLDRRVLRWARSTAAEPAPVAAAKARARAVAARLAAVGLVDDAAFAAARARRLARAGKSRRAIAAHLAARGVEAAAQAAVLPRSEEAELTAAVTTMRRRRIGPFRPAPDRDTHTDADAHGDTDPEPDRLRRELGALARAGFAEGLARRALALSREEADARLGARSGPE